jgi:serine/threonine-protein phosphatase 6 regulatory ankyrin repeat subunit B
MNLLDYCLNKNFRIAKRLLIRNKVSEKEKKLRDEYGNTSLMIASSSGETELVKLIVESKVNIITNEIIIESINDSNNRNETALMLASEQGHDQVVKLLLNYGAYVNNNCINNNNALIFASQKGYTNIVQMLLNHGADTMNTNDNDETVLSVAVQCGHKDIVKIILDRDYIFRQSLLAKLDQNGNTLLMLAIIARKIEIVKIIIEAITLNTSLILHRNQDGNNSLMLAIITNNIPITKMLLNIKIFKLNDINNNGHTALILAQRNGNNDLIKLLSNYKTIDDYFREGNYIKVLKLSNYIVNRVNTINSNDNCGICLENIVNLSTSCRHNYCMLCFTRYYCIQKQMNNCGLCRTIFDKRVNCLV